MLREGSCFDHGKYKILQKIGKGGMSVVWLAINEKANKTWAVKEVRLDQNSSSEVEAVKRALLEETNILKNLKHENLPSIADVIDAGDSIIVVMDYVEGRDLQDVLNNHEPQPQDKVIGWAKQLCDVLNYLHTREPPIIYRDMKPKNIMLSNDGKKVVLIDFGTARTYKKGNVQDTINLGTYGYAAPEQYGGKGQTDARTDIYGLGATLYQLLTGCAPGDQPYKMRPIREINPGLSSGLERIILKCTQENPDDRYQSAAELMYALDHYEEIDDFYRRKQKRKLGLFIATLALAVVLAVGGFVLNMEVSTEATNAYASKMEDASKSFDYADKLALYEECIAIPDMGGREDAYLGLIQAYKENDSVFTVDESQQLERLIKSNREAIQENPAVYTDICFETGKLFWYYFDDGTENRVTNAKYSIEWFQDALDNAPDDYENRGMATAYANIGIFYRDITTHIAEASDKGKYKPLFDNLSNLVDTVASDENESEIVRLELLEFTRNAIQQYGTKFKIDGVSYDEINGLYNRIEELLGTIRVPEDDATDVRTIQKENTLKFMESTKAAIDTAYDSSKGGNENVD